MLMVHCGPQLKLHFEYVSFSSFFKYDYAAYNINIRYFMELIQTMYIFCVYCA